jgi:hypothetical protein
MLRSSLEGFFIVVVGVFCTTTSWGAFWDAIYVWVVFGCRLVVACGTLGF